MTIQLSKLALLVFCFILAGNANAASFDINVNSDVFRVTLAKSVDRNQVADFGFLAAKQNRNHNSESVLHAGYNWVSHNFRIGLRSIYASPGNYDILAVGVGFQGRTALSRNVYLGGHFYYAPSALSFLDGDGYDEFAIRLMLKLGRSAFTYIGYRKFEIGISPFRNNIELDDDFHIGLKLYF